MLPENKRAEADLNLFGILSVEDKVCVVVFMIKKKRKGEKVT